MRIIISTIKHNDGPDPGIWNYYFSLQNFHEIKTNVQITKTNLQELYLNKCNFVGLNDRAISLNDFRVPNLLCANCVFQGCSSSQEEGGGSVYIITCNMVFHYTCALESQSPKTGIFMRIFLPSNSFKHKIETCTVNSCGSESTTGENTIELQEGDISVISSNLTKNKATKNSCFYFDPVNSKQNSAIQYSSFAENTAKNGEIILFYGFTYAYVGKCNFINNDVTYSQSACILYIERAVVQIADCCFARNDAEHQIDAMRGGLYLENCSIDKTEEEIVEVGNNVHIEKKGDKSFSLNLAHLELGGCFAVIKKTEMSFENNINAGNNNAIIKLQCSCNAFVFPFYTAASKTIPMFFFPIPS